jgi:hypothetical protein
VADNAWFVVTLREWIEAQRLQDSEHRAALIAAMHAGDTAGIRLLLQVAPFSNDQRRYLDDLLNRWEGATTESQDS